MLDPEYHHPITSTDCNYQRLDISDTLLKMNSPHVISGVRTVVNMASHFEELKAVSLTLNEQGAASTRGYFTPSEEEEIRHLLVSYWQSRNALYELVISLRDDKNVTSTDNEATFLIAYAGAILLVDAARFLYDTFNDNPIVKDKLNEPEPMFGIPGGVYDTVQKSLTSPIHVWHILRAMKYFDIHRAVFHKLGRNTLLGQVFEVIQRLEHRLDVSTRRYARARIRFRFAELAHFFQRNMKGRMLLAIQESVSRMMSGISLRPGHNPELPGDIAEELRALIRPGDIFITRKEHALTNYFLPGYWPHAALFIGNSKSLTTLGIDTHENVKPRWQRLLDTDLNEPYRVLEALKDGVWIRSLTSTFNANSIAVLRPRLSTVHVAEALARGLFHEGKPYDFNFDFTNSERLVCTEVVYRAYEGIGDLSFKLARRAGRMTLAAEDLVQMALDRNGFEPVAAFAPTHDPRIAIGDNAGELLSRTRDAI